MTQTFVSQAVNGIGLGMILFLMAFGLTLVFGILRFVNFAHGAFYALGAYATYTLTSLGTNFFVASAGAIAAVALFACALEMLVLRRVYPLSPYLHIVATFGLTLVIEEVIRIVWSTAPQRVDTPVLLKGITFAGPVFYPTYRLYVVACAGGCALLLWYLFAKTKYGATVRAGAENREVVALLGTDIDSLLTVNFVLGAALAALSGALVAPIRGVDPHMGTEALGTAFVVCVVGGLGSFNGAFAAALLIGLAQSLAAGSLGAGAGIVPYILMVAILAVRPRGLFAGPTASVR